MRWAIISIITVLLVGCTRTPDAIDRLVADLSSTHGMWLNGYQGIIHLPMSASKKQVLSECFKSANFNTTIRGSSTGYVKWFEILKARKVHIPSGMNNAEDYTAVLAHTDLGDKIVLLRPEDGWWWRAFNADGHYGRIELPPLQNAAAEMSFTAVESLLNQGADVNAKTYDGMTALHFAAMGTQTNILKILLAHQAKVNATNTASGWTPLHFAALFGHKDAVQILLENNADINAKATYGGTTPLHLALEGGHTNVALLLQHHGGHE